MYKKLIRKVRDGRGKLLSLLIKYAKIATLCPKHIRSYTKASYLCCFKLNLVYIVSIYDFFIVVSSLAINSAFK